MDEVVAADGRSVAVAREHHHVEVGPGHLDAGGDRQRPPVDGVHGAEVDVVAGAARAADAAHHDGVLALEAEVDDHAEEGPVTMPMPQPGHQMCGSRSVCRNSSISRGIGYTLSYLPMSSAMRSSTSRGVNRVPSILFMPMTVVHCSAILRTSCAY